MRRRRSTGELVFNGLNYSFLTVLAILFILPFIVIVTTSLVGELELLRRGNLILFPHTLDFTAYKTLLKDGSILYHAYGITFLRVTIGTAANLLFTSMMAFGISRKSMPGRNFLLRSCLLPCCLAGASCRTTCC